MPPRLSKRQQREQEELLALAGASTPDHVEEVEEEEEEGPSAPAKSGFAALMANSVDVEEDSSEEELRKAKKPKKKKKKESRSVTPSHPAQATVEQPAPSPSPSSSTPGPSKKERKALKKQKAKQKGGVDEIDQALQELSIKYPELQKAATRAAGSSPTSRSFVRELAALLSVSLSHVDPDAEMRKFFGKKVVDAAAKASPGPSSARRQPTTQRSNLTRPKPTWWPAKMRDGLVVRVLSDEEAQRKMKENGWSELEERWWTVEYSKRYKGVTLSFMQTVMSGDPDGLYAISRRVPWHADTILQVAEIFSHREEHSTAADYIERAIFAYERAFVGAFNFTSGINRLDFDRVENRPFYLAVHRYVIDLTRRGAHRTAFEFARLLYGLDPWTDPHGALLHLDFLAIKAGMHQWLLDIFALFDAQTVAEKSGSDVLAGRVSVLALPGWAYSRALAIRAKGGEGAAQESTTALKQAILSFPSVLPLLADKADISLSAEVRGHPAFKIFVKDWSSTASEAVLHLLSNLYVHRAAPLWKDPHLDTWLARTATAALQSGALARTATDAPGFHRLAPLAASRFASSVYRHTLVLGAGAQRLLSFIPADVVTANALTCDPLPPATAASSYDEAFFRGAESAWGGEGAGRRSQAATQRMLERLIPDAELRRQLQDLFEAQPALREQFPGGLLQFAQIAGQLPEDVLDDLLMNAALQADGAPEAHGGMPGGMPGDGMVELDFLENPADEQEELGAGEDEAGAPREQGGAHEEGVGPEEDADEDEEEDEEEEEEVAALPVRLLRGFINRFWGGTAVRNEDEDISSDDENT